MNWEQRFCANQACATEAWMVQRDPTVCEVWYVAAHEHEPPFTIAATDPVCPRCGTTLLTMVELDRYVGAEVGPVFEFIRSLS